MASKITDPIVISLNEEELRAVQLKGSGPSAKVIQVVQQDVKGVSPEDLSKTIQASLASLKTKNASVLYVVPTSLATIKNIEIPSNNPKEIESIVNLQAGRHTPFSRDEIQVGYIKIGVYKNNYTKILLVIVNKAMLTEQLRYFEAAGIKIKRVLFAPEGVSSYYGAVFNLKKDNKPKAVIDVGGQTTDFIVTLKGKTIASRSIPIGRAQLAAEGDAARDNLVEELGKTLESYKTEEIEAPPERFVVTSDDAGSAAVQAALKDKLKWEAEVLAYPNKIKGAKPVIKKIAELGKTSFLDLIATGCMVKEMAMDLLPEEVELQKTIEVQGREVFKAALLIFLILVVIGTTLGLKIYFQSTYLSRLQENYQDNRYKVEVLEDKSSRVRVLKQYLEGRMISLDTVKGLYENVPDKVYLTNVFLDEGGHVSIQGISEIASIVFNLGTTLKESEYFTSVNIKSTTAKKDRGKDVSAFEITLRLADTVDEYTEEAGSEEEEAEE